MAKVKKAQDGTPIIDRLAAKTAERNTKGPEFRPGQVKRMTRVFNANPERGVRVAKRMLKRANDKFNASPEMKKGGKMIKKAQGGRSVMDTKLKDVPGKVKSAATDAYNKVSDRVKNATVRDAVGAAVPAVSAVTGALKSLNRGKPIVKKGTLKSKNGSMLKRADGSYSQRGLWDNIRAAKGSGKKPTAAMLKQEKKIKAKTKK